MGNHKFKLSDMIPNAWFYKLKEIGNKASTTTGTTNTKPIMKNPKPYFKTLTSPPSTPPKSHKHIQDFTPNRASYYISTRLDLETNKLSIMDPPRKSKSRRRSKKRPIKPINCTTSPTDIIIDVASERLVSKTLPPIITKQPNFDEVLKTQEKKSSPKETYIQPNFDELVKTQEKKSPPKETYKQPKFDEVTKSKEKKSPPKESYKLKTRVKSPRVLSKHRKSNARKSDARKSEIENGVLDGFAVVKSSSDPHKDFRESMVEMIMENKICKSKDLEDLLACYLSLNSTEYHDVIVKVFEQIWFDFREIRV